MLRLPSAPAMYGNFQMAPRPTAAPTLARTKPNLPVQELEGCEDILKNSYIKLKTAMTAIKQGATKAKRNRKTFIHVSLRSLVKLTSYFDLSKKNQPVIAMTNKAETGMRMLQATKSAKSKKFSRKS